MKYYPMIMGAESVHGIFEGRKTMTRRVVTPQPPGDFEIGMYHPIGVDRHGEEYPKPERFGIWGDGWDIPCPYGQVGDRIWVRETWKPGAWRDDGRVAVDYMASPELTHTPWAYMKEQASQFIHRWLDEIAKTGLLPNESGRYEWEAGKSPLKWKKAMFMPRWASRLNLEIVNIRVERVQDITEEDAIREGVEYCDNPDHGFIDALSFHDIGRLGCPVCGHNPAGFAVNNYKKLWDSLNAKRGYPWSNNPWVWVIEFRRVDA